MYRLMADMSLRGQFSNLCFPGADILERWIISDVEELKVAVMTQALIDMDWFIEQFK